MLRILLRCEFVGGIGKGSLSFVESNDTHRGRNTHRKNMIATTFQGHPDLIKQAEVALGAYLGSTDGLLSAQTIQNMEAINAQILGNFTGASHK